MWLYLYAYVLILNVKRELLLNNNFINKKLGLLIKLFIFVLKHLQSDNCRFSDLIRSILS